MNIKSPLLAISVLCILFSACNKAEPKKVSKESTKRSWGDIELSFEGEKLMLLSKLKQIPYDTVYSVLNDYISATWEHQYSRDSSHIFSEMAIMDAANEYHLSERKIASLVFSYKYQALTSEDVFYDEPEQPEFESLDYLDSH
jgi:hypothetical protein